MQTAGSKLSRERFERMWFREDVAVMDGGGIAFLSTELMIQKTERNQIENEWNVERGFWNIS